MVIISFSISHVIVSFRVERICHLLQSHWSIKLLYCASEWEGRPCDATLFFSPRNKTCFLTHSFYNCMCQNAIEKAGLFFELLMRGLAIPLKPVFEARSHHVLFYWALLLGCGDAANNADLVEVDILKLLILHVLMFSPERHIGLSCCDYVRTSLPDKWHGSKYLGNTKDTHQAHTRNMKWPLGFDAPRLSVLHMEVRHLGPWFRQGNVIIAILSAIASATSIQSESKFQGIHLCALKNYFSTQLVPFVDDWRAKLPQYTHSCASVQACPCQMQSNIFKHTRRNSDAWSWSMLIR